MRLGWIAPILKTLYQDRLTIYRYLTSTNTDGTTKVADNPTAIISDVPCRISFESMDSPGQMTESSNPISLSPKLFVGPEINILAGDRLSIARKDDQGTTHEVYVGLAGKANWFPTHQEVLFLKEGDA